MADNFQHRELSGSVFKNDRKKHSNSPDYTGSALIDGVEYWVSGWIKDGARGKWMSLAFNRKDGGDDFEQSAPKKAPKPNFDDLGDDIPFSQGEHVTR